ncbi:hypothetical protein H7X65_03535 [Candidatus Parcubacteria bacterium]|nr:hypothetical protein [Candidatus Parcubacteria bacterium]
MFSDIVPPKKHKNKLAKIKAEDHEVKILRDEPAFTGREIYHTMDGRDRKSKVPFILGIIVLVILPIIYYSVFNNKTKISFEAKSTIFEIKDVIPMAMSEKNQNASSTLSYNLIYNNESKDRNIFAPVEAPAATTTVTATAKTSSEGEYYNLNTATTSPFTSIKVKLINETSGPIQVIKDTRFDVKGTTYYLEGQVTVKPSPKSTSTPNQKYKVIGFKGTSVYETFYAVDYISAIQTTVDQSTDVSTGTNSNAPNEDILSLIPENFISLKKNYVFDRNLNQSGLVVVDKRDFEKVLFVHSKTLQDYVAILKPVADLLEYEISINDYQLELDASSGLPVSFKNLTIEIKPKVKKDKVAATFKGFSKETMKKIKNDIAKYVNMDIAYSPFWVSKVSDEDHISVEVK